MGKTAREMVSILFARSTKRLRMSQKPKPGGKSAKTGVASISAVFPADSASPKLWKSKPCCASSSSWNKQTQHRINQQKPFGLIERCLQPGQLHCLFLVGVSGWFRAHTTGKPSGKQFASPQEKLQSCPHYVDNFLASLEPQWGTLCKDADSMDHCCHSW